MEEIVGLSRRKKRGKGILTGLLGSFGLAKRKPQRGRGGLSNIANTIGSILGNFGLAKRKKRGAARPKRKRVVRMRGAGWFTDALKGAASAVKDRAGVAAGNFFGRINPALGRLAQRGIYSAGSALGFARRKRKRAVGRVAPLVMMRNPGSLSL